LHVFEDDWKTNNVICKHIIEQCIHGTFNNFLRKTDDGFIVGDNSKPIFGNYDIISITEPIRHDIN